MTRIAIIGGGDSSVEFAAALQSAGADVVTHGVSAPTFAPYSVVESAEAAVDQADAVLVFGAPHLALSHAERIAPILEKDAVYAEFSGSTPSAKIRVSEVLPEGSFVDAALISPSAVEASGPGATAFAAALEQLSVSVVVVSENVGDVAARTLLRSLLDKSLATAITDTLWAAESFGLEDWAWQEIQHRVNPDVAQHLIDDAAHYFKRQQIEMQEVVEMLAPSGYDSTLIAPIQFNHGRMMHGKKIPHSDQPPTGSSPIAKNLSERP